MAKYRQKDDVDLTWNRIRRRVTRELDTQLADWREEALNKLLTDSWTKYIAAIGDGSVLELESEYTTFVGEALAKHIELPVIEDEAA